ncbi:MAG: hypothetical protein LC437_02620 [Thiohalomonas sp.]|nr:hypothetical protein [Thiohalomonas sp.]
MSENNNTNQKVMSDIIDEEIDLLEYVTKILNNKYKISLISIFCASIVYGLTYLIPVKYESFARVALVKINELGGVSPDNRRAPEAITLVEQDFITQKINDNHQDRVIARMRSNIFTLKFINVNELLPIIFHKRWDKEKKQWKEDFEPNLILASEIFKEEICKIHRNKENNLMTVNITLGNPKLAADIANKFVKEFNQYRRTSDINSADKKIAFLRKTLEQTDFLEMQKSLYRLIEAQVIIKMLASSKEQYAVEVLDPAIPSLYKSSPAKKKLTLLTFIGVFMLSIIVIVGQVVFKRINTSIRDYRKKGHGGA